MDEERIKYVFIKIFFLSDRQWAIVASIFMMATSAMGPGFLTQTAVFTVKLGAAFGFAILVSILIDYVVQQNIWRVVTLRKCVPRILPIKPYRAVVTYWLFWSFWVASSSVLVILQVRL
jgi:Mn2+/Fe2+ NRAMP family transporter